MDLSFCNQCDMKMDLYISEEDSKLYLGCKNQDQAKSYIFKIETGKI